MFQSTKVIELGSCAFRQWKASHSHCQYIHGYQLKAKLWFGCKELDEKNWAVDFGGLKDLKAILQNIFDHTYCIAEDDPALESFKALADQNIIQLRIFPAGVGIERTAECVLDIADELIQSKTNNRCWVERVEVFEHVDNSALAFKAPADKITTARPYEYKTPVAENPEPITTSTAAPVGNKVTQGYSGMFSGTRWG